MLSKNCKGDKIHYGTIKKLYRTMWCVRNSVTTKPHGQKQPRDVQWPHSHPVTKASPHVSQARPGVRARPQQGSPQPRAGEPPLSDLMLLPLAPPLPSPETLMSLVTKLYLSDWWESERCSRSCRGSSLKVPPWSTRPC